MMVDVVVDFFVIGKCDRVRAVSVVVVVFIIVDDDIKWLLLLLLLL